MSDTNQSTAAGEQWSEYAEEMNRSFAEAFEQNMRMQTAFLDSWRESLAEGDLDETTADGMAGASRAYEVWMEAADAQYDLLSETLRGEDVELTEFRDVWLGAANDAFTEVMGTSAFAAATGQTIGEMLEAGDQLDATNRETLHALGFATDDDLDEVGERLIELERRQHAVERKLDHLADLIEASHEEP